MELAFPIVLFLVVAGVLAAAAFAAMRAERRRREALAAVAAQLGFTFLPEKDYDLAGRFAWLDALAHGSNRYAHNVMSGRWCEHNILAFDYHYQVTHRSKRGSHTTHHQVTVQSLALPRPFPELRIVPEDFLSKIAQAVGFEDIDFESAEFSRTFTVRARDRKFAYDFCHPRAMEFLLAHPALQVEIEGSILATWSRGRMNPESIAESIEILAALRDLMPRYLFTEQPTHA